MNGGSFLEEYANSSEFDECHTELIHAHLPIQSGIIPLQIRTRIPSERLQAVRNIHPGEHQRALSAGLIPKDGQNKPEHQDPTVPTCLCTTKVQAAIAVCLRKLLDANGMKDVKIIGYEHNWDHAATHASQLVHISFIMNPLKLNVLPR